MGKKSIFFIIPCIYYKYKQLKVYSAALTNYKPAEQKQMLIVIFLT